METERNVLPVLAVGWDVGGWLGKKQAVAVLEQRGGERRWLGTPRSFRAAELEKEGPLSLIRLAWPESPPTILGTHRVVIAIDAPLGFPFAFQQLVGGVVPSTTNPAREIDSRLAYRDCERIIFKEYRKKALSPVFDKLGNNATVAQVFVRRWRAEHDFRVVPFQQPGAGQREIIEVYPALAKKNGSANPRIARLLPQPPPANGDEYDACICATVALAYAAGGEHGDLPPLLTPAEADAETATIEGWIYAPRPEWLAS